MIVPAQIAEFFNAAAETFWQRVAVLVRLRCLMKVFGARRLSDLLMHTGHSLIVPAVHVAARMRLNADLEFNPVKFERALRDLLSQLGEEHEREHRNRYRTLGLEIAVIEQREMTPQEMRRAEGDTLQAMRDGADVIYQGTFFDGRWTGRADFLIKVAEPSALGAHSYEVVDAKLARRVHRARHIVDGTAIAAHRVEDNFHKC